MQDVYEHRPDGSGLDPDAILSPDPPMDTLREAGLIPPDESEDYMSQSEALNEIVTLLREIRDNTGGSA